MKIITGSDNRSLPEAWAFLTREEAIHLYESLQYYFGDDLDDPGWHCHVGGGEGEPELTIAIVQ